MKRQVKYHGTYKDNFGKTAIIIENNFKTLFTEIDGVEFSGSEFTSLIVSDKVKYTDDQLKRFTFFEIPVYNTDIVEQTLCNCIFEVFISQLIIDKTNFSEFYSDLKIEYSIGNAIPRGGLEFEKITLSITIDGKNYTGTGDLIESAFDQIRNQFDDKYQFKNCYGCMFGDYSVFGQSSFGTMLCFVSQKDKYKKVTNKSEYMELPTEKIFCVQETYGCDKYEVRSKGAGYRG
jgi:hypothetical protein